jgi:hypothetical protein
MKTNLIRTFLDGRRQPLAASADTARLLDELCRQAPEFCAQVLADATTHGTQKAQLLAGLVGSDVDRRQIAQALRRPCSASVVRITVKHQASWFVGCRLRSRGKVAWTVP